MRAIYGFGQREDMSPTNANVELTYEERVRLRQMLDIMDQKQAGGMKEFDLNKPPVPAYVFREYPFLMYNHETGQAKAARNGAERELMEASGWSEDPFPAAEPPEIPLTAAEHAEVSEVDKKLEKRKRA